MGQLAVLRVQSAVPREQQQSDDSSLDHNGGQFACSWRAAQDFMKLISYNFIKDRIFCICCFVLQVSQTRSKKSRRRHSKVCFPLEVCSAPKKAVHSRGKNSELLMFIAPFWLPNLFFS